MAVTVRIPTSLRTLTQGRSELSGEAATRWLAPDTEVASLHMLLRACPAEALAVWPVDRRAGSPKYNYEQLFVRAA